MKRLVRKAIHKTTRFLPLRTLQALASRDSLGVFYHLVAPNPPPHMRYLYQQRPVDLFEQDLAYIQENFQPISCEDLAEQADLPDEFNSSRKIPLHISFDDGFIECFDIARPLLLEYNIPCTFFLATNFIDNNSMYYRNKVSLCITAIDVTADEMVKQQLSELNRIFGTSLYSRLEFVRWIKSLSDESVIDRVCESLDVNIDAYLKTHTPYLTREQVRILANEGFTIGAHSCRHQKLGRLSPSEIAEEIVASCQVVASITGQFSVPFSFPNSGEGVDRDFLVDLRRRHPQIGLIFDTKGLKQDRSFIINRIWVESPWLNPDGARPLPEILHRAYQDAISTSL